MRTDVAIAGGGLAGAAAACILARAGREVVLFERQGAAADKMCGEFLSVEAQTDLERLGLDLGALGGSPIETVRLVRGGRVAEARLPFRGLGLRRRVLDEALLGLASAAGADIRRGMTVAAVREGLELGDGTRVPARAVFLATGKRDLRGLRRPVAPMVGFKTYLALAPAASRALQGAVELVLVPGGHAGLQPVDGDRAVLCATLSPALLRRCGGTWMSVLAHLLRSSPHLAARIDGATPLLPRPLAISGVPYGFIHAGADAEALFRLGDQAAVIPSFTGDGMAIALWSGRAAAAAARDGQGSAAYHRVLRQTLRGQIGIARALLRLGGVGVGQAAIFAAARMCPSVLPAIARLTRIRGG